MHGLSDPSRRAGHLIGLAPHWSEIQTIAEHRSNLICKRGPLGLSCWRLPAFGAAARNPPNRCVREALGRRRAMNERSKPDEAMSTSVPGPTGVPSSTSTPNSGSVPDENRLLEAYEIIDNTPDMEMTIVKLRDLLNVDHVVYHSSKLGASPSADPYIRLTYPAAWIKRYLQMGYIDVDPVVREGFLRILPFDWSELKIESDAEWAFLGDALAHGVGPRGLSIPVQSKHGHRALFSISSSRSEEEWTNFAKTSQPALIQI